MFKRVDQVRKQIIHSSCVPSVASEQSSSALLIFTLKYYQMRMRSAGLR